MGAGGIGISYCKLTETMTAPLESLVELYILKFKTEFPAVKLTSA